MPAVVLLAASSVGAAGCMHEQLAWPPTRDDIQSINEAAGARNGWMRVQYVEPLATHQGAHVHAPTAIAAVDLEPGDGDRALEAMRDAGVGMVQSRMR